jgi:hypothetical protein
MKATVFFSSTARILFSSIMFLAGCGGLSKTSIPAPGAAGSAQGTFALVYVLSNPSGNNFEINAFSAGSNGQLTPVPGSPFAANVGAISANRNYLFGTDGSSIDSFAIASNGALTQVSSINGLQFNPHGGLSDLFLDRTGTTLYSVHFLIDGANDGYESYSVDHSTGALSYLGATFIGCCGDGPLSFMENNLYGYTTSCYHGFSEISGFKRNNDGTLTPSGGLIDFPDPNRLCPGMVTAGPTSNLAVSFGADVGPGVPPQGSGVVLAVYTVDGSGSVTTNSTVANMPQTAVGGNIVMSPSGKFLALGGLGLEVFHFNQADPITPFTGLLMNDPVDQISWDNDNNLYAISRSTSKLSVFTVTATSATQASGSPYTITNPTAVVVVPRK